MIKIKTSVFSNVNFFQLKVLHQKLIRRDEVLKVRQSQFSFKIIRSRSPLHHQRIAVVDYVQIDNIPQLFFTKSDIK